MGRYGYHVIDADGHVFEPPQLFEDFCTRFLDERFRPAVRRLIDQAKGDGSASPVPLYNHDSRYPAVRTDRQLGVTGQQESMARAGFKKGAKGAEVATMWDPELRMEDMDLEGVDVAVLYPSAMSSFCALKDLELEDAMYRAYNRAVADYCSVAPDRLKWVGLVSMRDMEAAVAEIRRSAEDSTMVGVYVSGHMDDRLLDDPGLQPIWEEAQALDLPVVVHGGTARPPYGIGTFEMGDNWFIQHSSTNPYEVMRAMAALVGGGVMDKFPKLRFAFLEAGCGWVPYWLDRLDEHAELMPAYVPMLKRPPSSVVRDGSQCFISCDPDESTLEYVAGQFEDKLIYASDYPHFDGRFPDSVRLIAEREGLSDAVKNKIFSENARRLYPRLA